MTSPTDKATQDPPTKRLEARGDRTAQTGATTIRREDRPRNEKQIAIIMPCYQDAASARLTIKDLVENRSHDYPIDIYLVNDYPLVELNKEDFAFERQNEGFPLYEIRLTHNVGQQKAIAIGACHAANKNYSHILIMDCDGEDTAEAAHLLIRECAPNELIVAKRGKRREGKTFRLGYALYKAAFAFFTGINIDFGNFMILPRDHAAELFSNTSAWVHVAATLLKARIPFRKIVIDRGARKLGHSKMNLAKLLFLGISATSIFSEMVVGRVFGLCQALWICTFLAIIYLLIKKVFFMSPLGWATILSLLLITLSTLSSLILITFCCLLVWNKTRDYDSIMRNYTLFIRSEKRLA